MNALTILGTQQPDIVGSFMAGQQARGQMEEAQNKNALRALLRDQGDAIMAGEKNALAQLAQFDPGMAWSMSGDIQDRDLNERQFGLQQQQAQHGMGIDNQRLAMSQEELGLRRQQIAMQVAEHAATMSAAEREEELAKINRGLAGATQIKDPAKWKRYMIENDLEEYADDWDNREVLFAEAQGIAEGLAMNAPPKPADRYRVVGDSLVDLTAERGPQSVFAPPPEPGFRPASPDEASRYGAAGGQFGPDNRFYPAEGQRDSALDARISALVETGLPREQAVGVATGRYAVNNGIVSDVATGQPVGGMPQLGTFSQPEAQGGTSFYGQAGQATGLGATAQALSTDTLGQAPLVGGLFSFPETVQSRQNFETATNDLIRALSVNPRFPVAEMERIRKEVGISPGALRSEEGLQARMRSVDDYLRRRLDFELSVANNAQVPMDQRQAAMTAARDMQRFIETMGAPKQGEGGAGGGTTSGGVRWSVE